MSQWVNAPYRIGALQMGVAPGVTFCRSFLTLAR